ncbi:MAG: hypothetical protein KJ643_05265 [Gammaproteobacteria bacterium]|nr:hypothetical protein [Gammaproteobacteria bacterium]MBU0840588.1 hypothetical protein [Gammaproteobacteria bacterium]MBU1838286.1 hypothetical protein [Gammaproteobacteria bacterium]
MRNTEHEKPSRIPLGAANGVHAAMATAVAVHLDDETRTDCLFICQLQSLRYHFTPLA